MKLWRTLKPGIKGAIMVLLGIWITRAGIGIDRLTTNLIYGPLAFFFLAITGTIVLEIMQGWEVQFQDGTVSIERSKIFKALSIIGGMYVIGIIITVYNIVICNIDIFVMFFAVFIGALWLYLGLYAAQWSKTRNIAYIVVSLAYALGLFYGAVLNTLDIPIYVYFFFMTAVFLQLSRELVKGFKDRKGNEIKMNDQDLKIFKFSLIFQVIAITFLVLPIFAGINYPILFFFPMTISSVFIGFGSYLTLKSILEKRFFRKINTLLKIGIIFELIAIMCANL